MRFIPLVGVAVLLLAVVNVGARRYSIEQPPSVQLVNHLMTNYSAEGMPIPLPDLSQTVRTNVEYVSAILSHLLAGTCCEWLFGSSLMLFMSQVNVSVGFAIKSIILFDELHGIVTTAVWHRMAWYDPRLKWDPESWHGMKSITMEVVGHSGIWIPDIVLYNTGESPMSKLSNAKAKITYDGMVFLSRPGTYNPNPNAHANPKPNANTNPDTNHNSNSNSNRNWVLGSRFRPESRRVHPASPSACHAAHPPCQPQPRCHSASSSFRNAAVHTAPPYVARLRQSNLDKDKTTWTKTKQPNKAQATAPMMLHLPKA